MIKVGFCFEGVRFFLKDGSEKKNPECENEEEEDKKVAKLKSMKLMFCILINTKVFYELIVLFLMGLPRHAQIITRVNLQYLCEIFR